MNNLARKSGQENVPRVGWMGFRKIGELVDAKLRLRKMKNPTCAGGTSALLAVLRVPCDAALPPADQAALLSALALGNVTLGVLADAPGSVYQAFPVCLNAQVPSANGCVQVLSYDATGVLLPAGSTLTPATIRITGAVGHFSTWAAVIVTLRVVDNVAPVISGMPSSLVAAQKGPAGTAIA